MGSRTFGIFSIIDNLTIRQSRSYANASNPQGSLPTSIESPYHQRSTQYQNRSITQSPIEHHHDRIPPPQAITDRRLRQRQNINIDR